MVYQGPVKMAATGRELSSIQLTPILQRVASVTSQLGPLLT
jgi:hypothetical protein